MSIFSLSWFKSKKQDKLAELKIEEQALKNELLRKEINTPVANVELPKPYITLKLVNDVLTVVLRDGSIVSKSNATQQDFNNVKSAFDEEHVLNLLSTKELAEEKMKIKAEIERTRLLQKGLDVLKNVEDFTVTDDNSVYLKGINRSLPQLLVEKFVEIVSAYQEELCDFDPEDELQEMLDNDEEYQSLKRFFMWCCLNPRAEVAHELYRFLTQNSFRITKQGFFVALRNVVSLHGSNELVHFVSNVYNKVKAVWKKNPSEYTVFLENGEYKIVHNDKLYKKETLTSTTCPDCLGDGGWEDDEWIDCERCDGTGEVEEYTYTETWPINYGEKIGSLVDLYLDLPNRAENRFTDDWTKTFDIRIGRVVNMPMKDCNWSTQDCAAAGLHFTSDQIHYVGCGDTSVITLINPMKVVGIGEHKGRCYEYLPIMTVPRDEATEILHDLDFDTLQLDEDYAIRELEGLAEKARDGFATEAKKYDFNIPPMSVREIENIVTSLDDMLLEISSRVVNID